MLEKLLQVVDQLIATRVPHRNGHVLADCTLSFISEQMTKESFECQTAATLYETVKRLAILPPNTGGLDGLPESMRNEVKKELGDTISIALHLMRALEMTPEELERISIEKLYERFPGSRPDGHQG